MPVSSDIIATFTGPGAVFRRFLSEGRDELRVLSFAIFGAILLFVAQTPWQAREAHLDPSGPLAVRLYWSGFVFILILPLLLYALSAVIWALSRIVAPRLTGYGIRLSVFWAILAASPLALLAGMMAGFAGSGPQLRLVGVLWGLAVLWFFVSGLRASGQSVPET